MRFALTALLALVSVTPVPSAASLGGKPSSVEADRKVFQGELKVSRLDEYEVAEITIDGTTVREYSLPGGVVFAVAWRGISQPDLTVLLGKYYEEYAASADVTEPVPRGHGPREYRSKHVVVEKFGHMRDLRGKAWVPGLLPRGFRVEDIK